MRGLKDFNFKNKRVIVRVDYNVPLDDKGRVSNDKRIRESIPTIKYLLNKGASVFLMSHLGRPDGKVVEKLRLGGVAVALSRLLKKKVLKLNDCVGKAVEKKVFSAPRGSVILLENLRFHPEEEKNDLAFAKKIANLADVYVDDAFGSCHRAHASVDAVAKFLPGCAGFLLEKEINVLSGLLKKPKHPFVAIMSGAKVSDKIILIKSLLKRADKILLGGAMSYTFYKSVGLETGNSLVENDSLGIARQLLKEGRNKLFLPTQVVVADKKDNNAKTKVVDVCHIPKDWFGLDVAPKSIVEYKKLLKNAKTVLWNGPVGLAEIPAFSKGTRQLAKFVAGLNAVTVVCGGDTGAVLEKMGFANKMTHVSTGGGAALEFLEGKKLPGVVALEQNKKKFKRF